MSGKTMDNKEEWIEMDEKKSREFSESFIRRAERKLEEAKRFLESYLPSYPESISAAQECMEFSIKAIFLMLLNKYPRKHRVMKSEFQEVMKMINELSNHIKQELLQWTIDIEEFPKLYLYSEFWQNFYTIVKYGDEELGIPAEKLFGKEEANLALKHAEKCYELASKLENYFKYGLKT
jgi:HEPN domain-containing protein